MSFACLSQLSVPGASRSVSVRGSSQLSAVQPDLPQSATPLMTDHSETPASQLTTLSSAGDSHLEIKVRKYRTQLYLQVSAVIAIASADELNLRSVTEYLKIKINITVYFTGQMPLQKYQSSETNCYPRAGTDDILGHGSVPAACGG